MRTILLLLGSNIFMTFAWYGHLRYKNVEYCLQVPANRIGSASYTTAQLKIIQEVITLVVFAGFSVFYLKEDFKWNYAVSFFFVLCAVFFAFKNFD